MGALYWASSIGKTAIVEALVAADPSSDHIGIIRKDDGGTALSVAKNDEIRAILTNAAYTSLYHQCSSSSSDLAEVQALIKGGINLRYRNGKGATALVVASLKGHTAIVQALIAADPSPEHIRMQGNNKATALIAASRQGFTAIAEALIAADPSPDHIRIRCWANGSTALSVAKNDEIKDILNTPSRNHAKHAGKPSGAMLTLLALVCGLLLLVCIAVGAHCYLSLCKDATGDIYLETDLEEAQPPAETALPVAPKSDQCHPPEYTPLAVEPFDSDLTKD